MLTDKEALALNKVLIKDNKKVKSIVVDYGTGGEGNTNDSPYTSDGHTATALSELADMPIEFNSPAFSYGDGIYGMSVNVEETYALAAVVEDIVYVLLRHEYTGKTEVRRIPFGKSFTDSFGIAYDTYFLYKLTPSGK